MEVVDILKHFGFKKQTKKFMEEASELHEALIEYRLFKEEVADAIMDGSLLPEDADILNKLRFNVITETADVLLLVNQFLGELDISDEEIGDEMNYKFRRTIDKYEIGRED